MCSEEELNNITLFLNAKLPYSKSTNRKVNEYLYSKSKYNSGLVESKKIKLIDENYELRIKEIINHEKALKYIFSIDKESNITEDLICNIHKILLDGIDDLYAGQYRTYNVRVSSSNHIPPQYYKLNKKMQELIDWYNKNENKLKPVELAAVFHQKMVYIHPFTDGNGRTARIVMNFILLKKGYPFAIFNEKARKLYDYALERAAIMNDLKPFIDLVKNESYETGKNIKKIIEDESIKKSITFKICSSEMLNSVVC